MENPSFDFGELVIVEAPDFFRGRKLAHYLKPCKIHDDAHECELTSKSITTRLVCVRTAKVERLEDALGTG